MREGPAPFLYNIPKGRASASEDILYSSPDCYVSEDKVQRLCSFIKMADLLQRNFLTLELSQSELDKLHKFIKTLIQEGDDLLNSLVQA